MNNNKRKLSKGILEMKFMKRTKEKVAKEDEEIEGRQMYASETTEQMLKNNGSNFIIEPSFVFCENLIDGRLSYRGMNVELERLMELEDIEKNRKDNGVMEKDVSDEEMTKYIKINKVINKGNKKFKKENKKK